MPQPWIVTDASVRFPSKDFLSRYPVTILPTTLRRGTDSLEDGPSVDLTAAMPLFEWDVRPATWEAASVESIVATYERLHKETNRIISIHTSSSLNGTVANARIAMQQFLGRCNIQVIDSMSFSAGLGMLVQYAAIGAERGAELEEIVRIVRGLIPRLYSVFFLDDMTYLERNRLVSRSQAILGNMLGVIPFVTMEEGQVVPMEKVQSRARAIEKLVEFVSEFASVDHIAILQNTSTPGEETEGVLERVRSVHPHAPIHVIGYGPSVATLVGLNSLGMVVLESEEDLQ
ncbi:MAG: DegV family protein [Anaerolineales bacterium]|nr:DegV family protein [Anaerolineales bacterium]